MAEPWFDGRGTEESLGPLQTGLASRGSWLKIGMKQVPRRAVGRRLQGQGKEGR